MNFLFNLVSGLITAYIWILIISSLVSMLAPQIRHPLLNFAQQITNPPLVLIRKNMPFVMQGAIDLSPLVLIIVLQIIRSVI